MSTNLTTSRSTAAAVLVLFFLLPGSRAELRAQTFDWFFDMETGFRTSGIAAGDFDRDGDVDLAFAVGEHRPSPTLVFFNDGRGNFEERQRITGRYQKGHAVEAVDFDGDGWLDLVLITEIGDYNMVFLNDGTGHFLHGWRFGLVGDNGRSLTLPDLDRDGRPDVVVVNRGQPNRAYRNVGPDGLEHWFDFGDEGGATVAVASADLNGDGWPDVVSADWSGSSRGVHVWLNDGAGHLVRDTTWGRLDESVFAIDAGDIDGDGDIDLAIAVGQRNPGDPAAEGFESDAWEDGGQDHILLNDGRGRFPRWIDIGTETDRSTAIRLADLDGDGDLDVAVGYRRGEGFYSYEGPGREFWFDRLTPGYNGGTFVNQGDGAFAEGSPFSVHSGAPHDLLAADVNADGYPDLVVAAGSGRSAVFLNSLGPDVGRWGAPQP